MERVYFAIGDELEHISKFKNTKNNVHTIQASENISKPHRDKKQKEKPIEFDFHSLNSTLNDLTARRIDVDQKKHKYFQTRLFKPDLPHRCQNRIKTYALKCKHCFYCGSEEHLQTGCLERLQDRKAKKKKLEEVASFGNEATSFVNSDSRCCLFCLKTRNEVEMFYCCRKCKSGIYCSKNCQRKYFKSH